MNRPILIILLVITAVFIFVLGGGAGILYQTQKDASRLNQGQKDALRLKEAQKSESAVKVLSSKLSNIVTITGKVIKIFGRSLTLSKEEESIEISVKEDAKVYSLKTPEISEKEKKSLIALSPTVSTFESIKVGDSLNINVMVLPGGVLETRSIIIYSSTPSQ